MLRRIVALSLLSLCLSACSEPENEDVTQAVNREGSVESAIQVTDLDNTHKLLTTTHKVWVNGSVYRTIAYYDTVPTLGKTTQVAENSDGDSKEIVVDKDYEIFITVK
ncbi:MAG: hypothetical protein EOO08_13275 [Chitinophagaceae bacterium]|nr:MAG: hypothetical protein EOO08_13275 [Chitinophagaceae bacterium]